MTPQTTATELKAKLLTQANSLGFRKVGICTPEAIRAELGHLEAWLVQGFAGEMGYLARKPATRLDAHSLLPDCRSVIVLAYPYYQGIEPAKLPEAVRVARYAWGEDYHAVVGNRLEQLGQWLDLQAGEGHRWMATCDTSPISEKAYAIAAGVGWRGKHSVVLSKELGSWFFVGLLLSSVNLPADEPAANQCGTCTRCIEACPVNAISAPGVLNASRCISYLTTARKSELDDSAQLDGWVYGCDVCQDVCPFNQTVAACGDQAFNPRLGILGLTPPRIQAMTAGEFDTMFAGSEVKRRGLARFKSAARLIQAN